MAILYGTTADGDSLPVEVNEFGQLIAQGLQGQPGAEGPPGPPGVGELPPDPFEGAILGWQNNALAWLGGSVPIPGGTYGPILEYKDGILYFESIPALPSKAELIMTDSQGRVASWSVNSAPITQFGPQNPLEAVLQSDLNLNSFEIGDVVQEINEFNQSRIWSQTGTFTNANDPKAAFDGSLDTYWWAEAGTKSLYTFNQPVVGSTYEVYVGVSQSNEGFQINGQSVPIGLGEQMSDITPFVSAGGLRSIQIQYIPGQMGQTVHQILVDGQVLVDAGLPPGPVEEIKVTDISFTTPSMTLSGGVYKVGDRIFSPDKSGVGSVGATTGTELILRADNQQWKEGFYVTVPEQELAARYVAASRMRNERLS
jgi:hypothetical protein